MVNNTYSLFRKLFQRFEFEYGKISMRYAFTFYSLDSSKFATHRNDDKQVHQICNIQIKELKSYYAQLESENLSLNNRLQKQVRLNDDLEKQNIILSSKWTNQLNEIEVLKTWMKQNTELQSYNKDFSNLIFYTVTQELQKIQSTTSSTFDLSKANNQNLIKKLRKYKKLLKHKDQEIHSLSQYGISESISNDNAIIFNPIERPRPMSWASNMPRFTPHSNANPNALANNQLG